MHNLNTMHSRAGAQTPFSSINYGTDTSPEGRMVIRNILLATDAGLGHGETPIFPIHIFKREGGRQLQPRRPELRFVRAVLQGERQAAVPQLLLYRTARSTCSTTSPAIPETEVAYHGLPHPCDGQRLRSRSSEIAYGRGNLSASPPSTCRAWPLRATATRPCSMKSSTI